MAALVTGLQLQPLDVGMPLREFALSSMMYPCLHKPSGMRVAITFSILPYESHAIARGRDVEIDGYPVRYASPEDLLIMKAIAGRARDLDDIKAIFVRNENTLDLVYVRQWLKTYTDMLAEPVLDRFNEVLDKVSKSR